MTYEPRDTIVVDDDPMLLSVLSELLTEQGYTVRTAADGFAALSAIRDRLPAILLSDLHMPRMSGFELLSVVRQRFPAIAVIAMSGAHAGLAVSPEIAADGFYAKGLGSIFGLLDILREVDRRELGESRRTAVPIWTPGLPIHKGDAANTAVACPECLRVLFLPIHDLPQPHETRCPHCQHHVLFAVVTTLEKLGNGSPPLSPRIHGTGQSACVTAPEGV